MASSLLRRVGQSYLLLSQFNGVQRWTSQWFKRQNGYQHCAKAGIFQSVYSAMDNRMTLSHSARALILTPITRPGSFAMHCGDFCVMLRCPAAGLLPEGREELLATTIPIVTRSLGCHVQSTGELHREYNRQQQGCIAVSLPGTGDAYYKDC